MDQELEKNEEPPKVANSDQQDAGITENQIEDILLEEINSFYQECIALKEEGNQLTNAGKSAEAEKVYIKGIEKIKTFKPSIPYSTPSEKVDQTMANIQALLKPFYSNLAFAQGNQKKYKEAYDNALYVIEKLDPLFDKSYIRIMIWAIEENNLLKANQYARLMRERFPESTIKKYEDRFKQLDTLNEKANPPKKKKITKLKKILRNPYAKWILGTLALVGTGFALTFLFRKSYSRFYRK